METASVPCITMAVYFIMQVIKRFVPKEEFSKFIPIIAMTLGGIIGIIVFYYFPDCILAKNWLSAITIGAASGLSATGIHQAFKQLYNNK